MFNKKRRQLVKVIGLNIFSLLLVFYGFYHIAQGKHSYSNYWGGQVFAPVAIVAGVLLSYIACFRIEGFSKKSQKGKENKPRPKYPWEDFRKW